MLLWGYLDLPSTVAIVLCESWSDPSDSQNLGPVDGCHDAPGPWELPSSRYFKQRSHIGGPQAKFNLHACLTYTILKKSTGCWHLKTKRFHITICISSFPWRNQKTPPANIQMEMGSSSVLHIGQVCHSSHPSLWSKRPMQAFGFVRPCIMLLSTHGLLLGFRHPELKSHFCLITSCVTLNKWFHHSEPQLPPK